VFGPARSTLRPGCGQPGTSGHVSSSPGSPSPREIRFSRRSRPHSSKARRLTHTNDRFVCSNRVRGHIHKCQTRPGRACCALRLTPTVRCDDRPNPNGAKLNTAGTTPRRLERSRAESFPWSGSQPQHRNSRSFSPFSAGSDPQHDPPQQPLQLQSRNGARRLLSRPAADTGGAAEGEPRGQGSRPERVAPASRCRTKGWAVGRRSERRFFADLWRTSQVTAGAALA
jgi:hypothetical protein